MIRGRINLNDNLCPTGAAAYKSMSRPSTRGKSALSAAATALVALGSPHLAPVPAPTISPPESHPASAPPKKRRRRDPLGLTVHQERYEAESTSQCYLTSDWGYNATLGQPQDGYKARRGRAYAAQEASRFDPMEDATPVKTRLGTRYSTTTSTYSAPRRRTRRSGTEPTVWSTTSCAASKSRTAAGTVCGR